MQGSIEGFPTGCTASNRPPGMDNEVAPVAGQNPVAGAPGFYKEKIMAIKIDVKCDSSDEDEILELLAEFAGDNLLGFDEDITVTVNGITESIAN